MFKSKKVIIKADENVHRLSTLDLLKTYVSSKLPKIKSSATEVGASNAMPDTNLWDSVNHIAILLDGKVEDVIRTQDRMAALLLSQPEFIEYVPSDGQQYPVVGSTYQDGKFVAPENKQGEINAI